MARGSDTAAPRFRPPPRGPSPLARLLPVAIVLGLVLVGSLAWGNRGRLSLRCTEGRLEAHRGTVVPWREVPLEDPIFVPLPVSEDRCIDKTFGSRRALESAYLDAAVTSVDHAISSGSAEDVQRGLATLDLIIAAAEDRVDTETLQSRRKALLSARLRVEVDEAQTARERALTRIEQAREAGIDEAYLDELARELGNPESGTIGSSPMGDSPTTDPPTSLTERAL